ALRALGAEVSPLGEQLVQVSGSGGFAPPAAPLDCANSGTAARLLCGPLAARPVSGRRTGDASRCRRPMRRVTEPLAAMGATFTSTTGNLPLTIHGAALQSVTWTLPVASAQAKSAILLAAALAGVDATVHEPAPTRDHTE